MVGCAMDDQLVALKEGITLVGWQKKANKVLKGLNHVLHGHLVIVPQHDLVRQAEFTHHQ